MYVNSMSATSRRSHTLCIRSNHPIDMLCHGCMHLIVSGVGVTMHGFMATVRVSVGVRVRVRVGIGVGVRVRDRSAEIASPVQPRYQHTNKVALTLSVEDTQMILRDNT